MIIELLKYHVVGDRAAGRRDVASGAEIAASVALADGGELLLDPLGRTPFDSPHEVTECLLRCRGEHVDVVIRYHALDDPDAEFRTGLTNDLTHATLQVAANDSLAIPG